ncbi:MAG TPA: response regulator transcription factor [Clostridiaceae bacterium]|nr:response regulator transcription factor [Clostridiaceae bacterium]
MPESKIIIVEDDAIIAELIDYNLQTEDYETLVFASGQEMFTALENAPIEPLLFLLDIMLPEMDGYEICERLKSIQAYKDVPILMLTARSSEQDKVKGLDLGADDYLTKPFGIRELLSRVRALLRRSYTVRPEISAVNTGSNASATTSDRQDRTSILVSGSIILDDAKHQVYKDDKPVTMTNREYELLKFLMKNRGIAYSRDDLLNYVWGYDFAGETRTVDVHIRQLRRKIEDDSSNPLFIETVRGRGYRFRDDK